MTESEPTPEESFNQFFQKLLHDTDLIGSDKDAFFALKKGADECIELARKQEREKRFGEYLNSESRQQLGNLMFPQYALGLQSCKTIGEVVSILKEIEQMAEERGFKRGQAHERLIRIAEIENKIKEKAKQAGRLEAAKEILGDIETLRKHNHLRVSILGSVHLEKLKSRFLEEKEDK